MSLYIGATPTSSLLLDLYPSATVAYSFRKLRTAYGGSAVRIRRSSDDAEADIGFSGNDFDTAAAAAHIGGGSGFIVTWYDQSGNGDNVTQATTSNQPSYIAASELNSKPAADFNVGVSPSINLRTAVDTIPLNGTTASAFAVASLENGGYYVRILSFLKSGDFDDFESVGSVVILEREASTQAISSYRNNTLQSIKSVAAYNTGYRMAAIFDATNNIVYVNNVAGTTVGSTGTIGGASGGTICVGNTQPPPFTNAWLGNIGEVVLWASDQTANRTAIDANQSAYWGL